MAVIKYKFEGMKELSKALDNLTEPKFRKAALRRSGKAAMSPLVSALKNAAPVFKNPKTLPEGRRPGELRDDIKMSVSVNIKPKLSKSGKITKASKNELKVTVKTGKLTEDYAMESEYGRNSFKYVKFNIFGKPSLGFETELPALKPEPWMRPTFDRMKGTILSTFRKELGNEVILQAKKQKKFKGK